MKKSITALAVGGVLIPLLSVKAPDAAAISPAEPDEDIHADAPSLPRRALEGIREARSATPSLESARGEVTSGACPSDMVSVEGEYCPYVFQRCIRYLDPITKLQCAEFQSPSGPCIMHPSHKRFCMDKYEYPNKRGEKPVFMTSWLEAKDLCEKGKKRLCTDSEWTLACEGAEHLPYPYGYKRSADVCNIDRDYPKPDPNKVYGGSTQSEELARLDRREPSGTRDSCVSPFGVHDMVGNVDEWVVNETQNGWPFRSGLKGGYWGPVRTRCRPMTTGHPENFRYYQIGFRCCGDAPTTAPATTTPNAPNPTAARETRSSGT